MNNLPIYENQIEILFKKIYTLSAKNNHLIYLIYQSMDTTSILSEMINEKKIVALEYEKYQINFTPALVELNLRVESDKAILKQSIADFYSLLNPKTLLLANARQVYGWLISSLDIETLAMQIGMIAVQPSNRGEQLLRYYDPVIFLPLMSIFCEKQRQKLINSVNYWLLLNGDGELVIKENSQTVSKQLGSYLDISELQWQSIIKIESRNAVLARYRLANLKRSSLTEKEADQIILNAFQSATEKGYTNKKELIEYAYRCLTVHSCFLEHPIIKSVIEQNRGASLMQQLSAITNIEWDRITKECHATNTGDKQ